MSALADYYGKIFSSLSKSNGKLLTQLIAKSGVYGLGLDNSFKSSLKKKAFLGSLLAGPSLDYLKSISDRFQLKPLEKLAGHRDKFNAILFLRSNDKMGKRSMCNLVKIYERIANSEKVEYCGFVIHNHPNGDYALIGIFEN
ncbi:hypothetical protein HY989_02355 [Candidatus Micrarchaeota archaeon]|nr:hypothetical protein [Candidatus Micrarchaeota archaeon]